MELGLIDFPFLNDGLGYFSKLAAAYNEDSFFLGIKLLWSIQEQGLLLFSWLFTLSKIFGFSYPLFIVGQVIWCLGLCFILTKSMNSIVAKEEGTRHSLLSFFFITVFFFAFGFFSAVPGNVFDLRVDISGALFLCLALVHLAKPGWKTTLFVFLAFFERFHSAGVLGLVTVLLMTYSIAKQRHFNLKNIFKIGIYPLLGIFLVFLFRWQAVKTLISYYSRVQYDSNSDWVVGWGSPGFFSFYPIQFYELFLGNLASVLLFVSLLVLTVYSLKNKKEASSKLFLYLTVCSLGIMLMLFVNPTRNNGGVLRFALAPLYAGISFYMFRLLKSKLKYSLYILFSLFLFMGVNKAYVFNKHFDYWSLRKDGLKNQVLNAYDVIYEKQLHSDKEINVGAMYALEYNFSGKLWNVYLALRNKKALGIYRSKFGVQHRIRDKKSEVLTQFEGLDFLAVGNSACWTNWIPADATYKSIMSEYSSKISQLCPKSEAKIVMGRCVVSLLSCNGQPLL